MLSAELLKKVHKNQQGCTLFCGDFNLVPDPSIDVKGPSPIQRRKSVSDSATPSQRLI